MLNKRFNQYVVLMTILVSTLSSCFNPPYNNFKPDNRFIGDGIIKIDSLYKTSRLSVIDALRKHHIQFEQYGDIMTIIIPTDSYFHFNSPHLNEPCYPGLLLILKLLAFYPHSTIYIAGFTDNIGSRSHKNKLSQAQAETMLTFLWANDIQAQRLDAQGYGERYAISDNASIHGSAQNRRIELQWFNKPIARIQAIPYLGPTK